MKKIQFKINNFRKKRKGVSIIILCYSLIAIFALCTLVIDLGIILNCRYEFQKLIETAALASITDYEAYENPSDNTIKYPTVANISTNAGSSVNNNINAFIKSNSFLLMSQNITPTVTFGTTSKSKYSRAIKIDATAVVKTYFLQMFGIKSIKIPASAAAMHIPVYLKSGNILNGVSTYKDTDIRDPVGGAATTQTINGVSYTLPAVSNVNNNFDNIYGIPDGKALSLGPGGYVTIKLPATLVDGKGFDLQIITAGNIFGYFVFAGNDVDPANPYVDAASPGAGIQWVNISCTGTPVGTTTNGAVGSYNQWIDLNGNGIVDAGETQAKFYGSGYFDLGATCSSGYNVNIKSAKYLKIIDDNVEDGFTLKDPKNESSLETTPSFFSGQNSSIAPGVSIDAIAVEHHSRLISSADFALDTDGDGLLDVFENSFGLNPSGSSDGSATNNDALKFWGYITPASGGGSISGILIDNPTTALRLGYPTRLDNPPKLYVNF